MGEDEEEVGEEKRERRKNMGKGERRGNGGGERRGRKAAAKAEEGKK